MTTGAIYSTTTGIIQSTISPPLSDEAQITALAAQGLGHMTVPDGTTGANAMVDLSSGQLSTIAAAVPVPHVIVQYVAAQINAGTLPSSSFHPSTIAAINASLSAASMTPIATASTPAAGAATTP